jgi:hypothetical protein
MNFPTAGTEDVQAAPPEPQSAMDHADILAHLLERLSAAVDETGSLTSANYVSVRQKSKEAVQAYWTSKAKAEEEMNAKTKKRTKSEE